MTIPIGTLSKGISSRGYSNKAHLVRNFSSSLLYKPLTILIPVSHLILDKMNDNVIQILQMLALAIAAIWASQKHIRRIRRYRRRMLEAMRRLT